MLVLMAAAAAALTAQPGRDPQLLHRHVEQVVAEKEAEQEATLRRLLELGGARDEHAEILARLAGLLRQRALALNTRGQAELDEGKEAEGNKDKSRAADARAEAIARYRDLLKKHPDATRTDEALFYLADTLQEAGRDDEAVTAARELVKRFPRSQYAPSTHVFIGEHLFDKARLDEALKEYRAAAQVPSDEVYPYALYKAAWCRFNQSAFGDAMKLLHKVVEVSQGGDAAKASAEKDQNKVQLAKEARRDYVIAYSRVGKPEAARDEFAKAFGAAPGKKMLEQYGKLLFDQARDPEAVLIHRQLLELHGDEPAAALDQTRLLVIAQRGGRRAELLKSAQALVEKFNRVRAAKIETSDAQEIMDEANRLAEETLRNLAVQVHNEARKTDLDDTWSSAHALYTNHLALFPDAPDAYDLRFFDGELLYARKQKPAAAEQYEHVVRQDLAALKAGKQPGKWLQKAAWSAVLSRAESLEQKDDKGTAAQRKLTPGEELLAKSCLLYLEALPEGPHAVEVAFKAGRLEYLSSQLPEAEKHLAWIAQRHPENELAEYAANLVLDISNIRKDWAGLHGWAVKFLTDPKLTAHGTLQADLTRIEEQSAYALADGQKDDVAKAAALQKFVDEHPKGMLADKALFGAAAALSRAGRIDDALAARARVWKELQQSPLVPRALLASAADHAAIGDFGESASLLEKYALAFQRQKAMERWRREHDGKKPAGEHPSFDEAKAREGLHDAAALREARGELKQAIADRQLSMNLWQEPKDKLEQLQAIALMRARLGDTSRAARELAGIAREAQGKAALQLTSWREAAKLFAKGHETANAQWAWTELEKIYKALGPKARAGLTPEAVAAAADAHLALGNKGFEDFRKQEVKAPLMKTLNRKIALLQVVKKRAEETVSMRQAEPAVCALAQLGEAQMLLGKAIAESPFPPGLNAEQKKLYREAVGQKAAPLYEEAKGTLAGADEKAQELGVTGGCTAHVAALLEKLGSKAAARATMDLPPAPLAPIPEYVDAEGNELGQEGGEGGAP